MADLVPRKPESNESGNDQRECLVRFLEGYQERYRTEMGDGEYLDWLQTLKRYPLEEIIAAANELTLHPPEDWSGMPKLPDLLRVIHRERGRKSEELRRQEGQQLMAEMKELEKRKANGEQFFGLRDVLRALNESKREVKKMPEVNTIWPDIDPEKNKAKLDEQRRRLESK